MYDEQDLYEGDAKMAVRGKSINLFLMDGSVNGRVKYTLANWTGLIFKIPRTALNLCKDRKELKQTGVYFLFGKDEKTDKDVIYVGQASVRKNGEGILNRLCEHDRDPNKDYWTEAMAITTSNDSLGPTEISYLEHTLCKLARDADRYIVKNGNDPTTGNLSEEKITEMEDFIDYVKIIIGTSGHKVFIPLSESDTSTEVGEALYCIKKDINAIGVRTSDGFVVKKGSKIASNTTNSCPDHVLNKRQQHKSLIGDDFVITKDILFNTPSGAAAFVCGSSANGNVEWKNANGVLLRDINSAG